MRFIILAFHLFCRALLSTTDRASTTTTVSCNSHPYCKSTASVFGGRLTASVAMAICGTGTQNFVTERYLPKNVQLDIHVRVCCKLL